MVATGRDEAPRAGAWWCLFVLALIYTMAFVDRTVMGLAVEPLRRDLGLSDTQIGLLTGFAFVLLYALAGLPLGRIVDRTRRVPIIAGGTVVWSLATAACGLASGFGSLFVARMGVGLGEATLNPAAGSLLADYFPRQRLGRAMAIYTLGGFVGGGAALIGGGALLVLFARRPVTLPGIGRLPDWSALFVTLGVISALLLPLLLTIREPPRTGTGTASPPALGEVWRFVRQNLRPILSIFLGIGFLAAVFAAVQAWVPALLARRYGLAADQAALYFGGWFASAGALGNFAGGWLVDHFRKRGHADAGVRAGLVAAGVLPLTAVAFAMAPGRDAALVLLGPLCFAAGLPFSIAPPTVQLLAPNRMRGQLFAAYLLTASMVGFGGGPVLTAVLGEKLYGGPGGLALGFATAACICGLCSAVLLTWGLGRTVVATDLSP